MTRIKFGNVRDEIVNINQKIMEKTKLTNFKVEVGEEKEGVFNFHIKTESLEDQK